MKNILIAGLLTVAAMGTTTAAMAHSVLNGTVPADEAVLAEMPVEITLDFKMSIRLTRVTLTHADHPTVDLELPTPAGFVTEYALPMDDMGSGDYEITWRGLGQDGHALNSSFNFTVE